MSLIKESEELKALLDQEQRKLDPANVDFEWLMSLPQAVKVECIYPRLKEILDFALMRVKSAVTDDVRTMRRNFHSVPETILDMCPDKDASVWALKLRQVAAPQQDFWIMIYTAYRVLGISCHELYFGSHKPSGIPIYAELYLQNMKGLPGKERNKLLKQLKDHKQTVSSPWYLIKTRLQELADDLGYTLEGLLSFPFFTAAYYSNLTSTSARFASYIKTDLSPDAKKTKKAGTHNRKPAEIGTSVLLLVCVLYAQGADRFLLQDYSQYAVHSDLAPLSAEERKWLSALLTADPDTQRSVIASLEKAN